MCVATSAGDATAMTTTAPRTSLRPPLVGALRGTVLEPGPGDRLGPRARVLHGRAEQLVLPEGSVGAVVRAFVLCPVADQAAALTALVGGHREPDRETGRAITRAGFDVVDPHRFDLPGPLGAGSPHIAGAAQRRCDLEGRFA